MIYTESRLNFDFSDEDWSSLVKFDDARDYLNAISSMPNRKGVDFIGVFKNHSLVLIEVKNFRDYRIENKSKLDSGNLWQQVSWKMRDSLAIIIAGARNSTHQKESWKSHFNFLSNEKKSIHFILWLEQDSAPSHPKIQKKREWNDVDLRRDLKRSLSWLSKKIEIASIENNPFPEALTVSHH